MNKVLSIILIILIIVCIVGFATGTFRLTLEIAEEENIIIISQEEQDEILNQIQLAKETKSDIQVTVTTKDIDTSNPMALPMPNIVSPIDILDNGFELPINGATGYCSISMKLKSNDSSLSSTVDTLKAGTGFQIIEEKGDWWYVLVNDQKGWLESKYCMINLPDVIPSIIYDDTNSYSSIFMSSGEKLPNVTGKALYNVYAQNDRLGKREFIMPVMYSTSKLICKAQHLALENDQSLKIYETFRPYYTQKTVADALADLMEANEDVSNAINVNGWNSSWFIAQVLSNHQRGIAIDVSLVDINKSTYAKIGNYSYLKITEYTECKMPTQMHELSSKAVTFTYGVNTQSKTAWKSAPLAKTMTESAKTLQSYLVEAGMYPIASEWWHFNDLDSQSIIGSKNYSNGRFYITKCYSTVPK